MMIELSKGLDIVGFGPIGRELAKRLVSEKDLSLEFSVVSIADSSGSVYPKNRNDVLKAVDWKNSGRKLSELNFGKKPVKNSSIFVDLTNSDYNKAEEAKKRAIFALREGKHFVSASKVSLSNYFPEISSYAKRRKLEIGFGATICGGRHAISVANNIQSDEIQSVNAVLNASTTMIFSMMEENHDISFDAACKKASESGVLESDWRIDLDGIDAAAKTAILGNVLFPKSKYRLSEVSTQGIRDDKTQRLINESRSSSNSRIRLISEITKDHVSVAPAAIPAESPLAASGRFNVVLFNTKTLGEISVRNLGGGVELTASVVISDLKRIASVKTSRILK